MADTRDKLDDDIVARLKEAPAGFTAICARFEARADGLVKPDPCGHREGWRLLDRRLQALRKAGRIRFNGKAWEVVNG